MSPEEERALLELFAVTCTVFEEDPYVSPNAQVMSLRRIAAANAKAVTAFSDAPTIGKGR